MQNLPGLDLGVIVSQGVFAMLFVYLFIDTRRENARREERASAESREREKIMRESFAMREEKFLDSQSGFLSGLHENTVALGTLTKTLDTRLGEMKEHIERNELKGLRRPS